MLRSFTDRVLAGVCGGIGEAFRINAWLIRIIWVVLTIASVGFGLLAYLALWWVMPQRLPAIQQRRTLINGFLVIVTIIAMGALWISYTQSATWLTAPNGQTLFLPLVILLLGSAFLVRQMRIEGS